VGRPVPDALVRIIGITDEPIATWSDALLAPPGTIGEITVRGPSVTREYFGRPEQTRLAKIREGEEVVHRMGDLGYLDEQGRLWMCGRKSHRVEAPGRTWFTVPVEERLNQHPEVRRTALVGTGARGAQVPVVLVEREPEGTLSDAALLEALGALAAESDVTRGLLDLRVYPGQFPVDARHNAKIEREALARWVEGRR
jgi:acyl-CoA synthetase (AMP-forming)/AMP-acid ligase II